MVDLEPILQKYTTSAEAVSGPVPSYVVAQHIREMAAEIRAAISTEDLCPVCAEPFKAGDMCATDIDLGTCHAACLEGSPVVDLDTGEPVDGPATTYRYDAYDDPRPADERAIDALPLTEIRRRVRNIWGAILSNQVVDKDVEGQAKSLLDAIDAALKAQGARP